jgi:F0F1-type ATP synthase membrane subunit b/b'
VSEQAFFWIAGIFAGIVAAIGGAVWKHVVSDSDTREKIAERIAKLETNLDHLEADIESLRKDRHDFKDEAKRAIFDLINDRADKLREDLRRMFREER